MPAALAIAQQPSPLTTKCHDTHELITPGCVGEGAGTDAVIVAVLVVVVDAAVSAVLVSLEMSVALDSEKAVVAVAKNDPNIKRLSKVIVTRSLVQLSSFKQHEINLLFVYACVCANGMYILPGLPSLCWHPQKS